MKWLFVCGVLSIINAQAQQQDFGPDLSPDGATVVYYSYRNDSLPDIYVMDLNSGIEQRLTTNYQSWDLNPRWAPDGSIYFSSDENGDMAIFSMQSNGTMKEQVTFPTAGNRHSEISFDMESMALVYAEFRSDQTTVIKRKDLESGAETIVLASKPDESGIFKPSISADGQTLLFLRNMAKDESYEFDVFTMDIKTGDIKNITKTQGVSERMPKWSEDQRSILFSADANSNSFDLYQMTVTGSDILQLTYFPKRHELNGDLQNDLLLFDAGYYGSDEGGDTYLYVQKGSGEPQQLTGN